MRSALELVVAYGGGLVFALGLGVSGMTHPSKVLAFLDVAGAWDPSLALVMGAGVLVNLVGFRLADRAGRPLLAPSFGGSPLREVDARLLGGGAVFGVGWGLGGFCPGPAIVSVVGGAAPVVGFVVAMLASMAVVDLVTAKRPDRAVAGRAEV